MRVSDTIASIGRALLLTTCLGVSAIESSAQAPVDVVVAGCPDLGIERVESKIKYGRSVPCGSGIRIETGPVRVNTPRYQCPLFIVYEPPHDGRVSRKGYFTRLGAKTQITKTYYECRSWRLFWLFPLSSSCKAGRTENAGVLWNHDQFRCPANGGN